MKHFVIAVHALTALVLSALPALAEEKTAAGGGYEATAYVWFGLIAVIVIYGIYDTFFRPVD